MEVGANKIQDEEKVDITKKQIRRQRSKQLIRRRKKLSSSSVQDAVVRVNKETEE
jgi:hypothetical protein